MDTPSRPDPTNCRASDRAPHSGWWAALALTLASSLPAGAAPGDLDVPSFGSFGRHYIDVTPSGDTARAMVRLQDGRYLIAGHCGPAAAQDACIVRRNANGTADPSFGSGGQVVTHLSATASGHDEVSALLLLPDGRFVIAGTCMGTFSVREFCLARYSDAGVPDASFGTAGIQRTIVGAGDAIVTGLARTYDGKLVVGGSCWDGSRYVMCAARFLPNGALDPSFGLGGRRLIPVASPEYGNALRLDANNRVLIAGSCAGETRLCVRRLTADGTLDTAFGSSGVTGFDGSGFGNARAVLEQADGKIVIAGECNLPAGTAFCLGRFSEAGVADPTFGGSDGTVRLAMASAFSSAAALALEPGGRILVAGTCFTTTADFCLTRLDEDGLVDTAFGVNGIVRTNVVDAGDFAYAMVFQPNDGKIALAGQCAQSGDPANTAFCLARYEGGPFAARRCSLDIDQDGALTATRDAILLMRIVRDSPDVLRPLGVFGPGASLLYSRIRAAAILHCGVDMR